MEQYVRVEKGRLESSERRATSYFQAMLRANESNHRLRKVLQEFVRAYANVERRDSDHTEIELFKAWLKAAAVLGIQPPLPDRAPSVQPK